MAEELVVQIGLGRRVQVRRARARQWTRRLELRFLDALGAGQDVRLAASSTGMTPVSAYRHRAKRPGFALRWHEALSTRDPELEAWWVESAVAFLTGEAQSPENPVRVTSIDEVLRMMEREARAERRPDRRRGPSWE